MAYLLFMPRQGAGTESRDRSSLEAEQEHGGATVKSNWERDYGLQRGPGINPLQVNINNCCSVYVRKLPADDVQL